MAGFNLMAQEYPDRHNTTLENSWMSCTPAMNPNDTYGNSHWIMYDFGTTYALYQSTFWNVNAYEHSDNGIQDLQIDYSLDGEHWINWGRYNLSKAGETGTYQGEQGPNFDGLVARYFLITASTNYGGTCYGLSEFKVESTPVTISETTDELVGLDISASPNPFSDLCKVSIGEELTGDVIYKISDLSGRVVKQGLMHSTDLMIDGSQWVSGVYVVTILHSTGSKSIKLNLIK